MITVTSRAFVESPDLLLLAQTAETWSCRPSELLAGNLDQRRGNDQPAEAAKVSLDATVALQIDVAAAAVLWRWKDAQLKMIGGA